MKGRAIPYSAAEMAWLEQRKDWVIADLHGAFVETFQRNDVEAKHLHSLRKRRGWKTGRTGCFVKGQTPPNKGKKCEPGKGGLHPNARHTQFKSGQKPHNTNYLGHERVSKDGYVEISVAERNPHTGFERRYVLKHRYLWEQANGPLPEGYCLKCLGEKTDMDLSNWEPVPRAILPRLNGRFGRDYDAAAPEVKPAIMAIAKLEHRARTLKRTSSKR